MVLIWEEVKRETKKKGLFGNAMDPMLRAKVPGGWFVRVSEGAFFYSDPEHIWDGSSLP